MAGVGFRRGTPVVGAYGEAIPVMGAFGGPLRRTTREDALPRQD